MRCAMSEARRRLLLAMAALAAPALRAEGPSPQQILSASDAIRNPGQPFSVGLELMEYRQGAATSRSRLLVWAKTRAGSGQFRSIVRFLEPQRDRDKLMLRDGSELWFFDPETKATVRVAPQQRLLGQASNADVVAVNLALDYHAVQAVPEEIADGDRQTRRSQRLVLEAATVDAAYRRIELWVDAASSTPLKARFYAESGRLLKTAYYRKVQPELGALRPTETVIIDGIDTQWVTVLRYSNFAFKDIPESWFQRDQLSNIGRG